MDLRFVIILLSVVLGACASKPAGPESAALEALDQSRLDEVYRLPGVDFGRWTTLYVEAPEVIYDRNRRTDPRHRKEEDFQLNERDLEQLRKQLVKALEVAWGERPGWTLVDEPGPDTLVLQPVLSNFHLSAPIRDDYPGIARNYTRESSRFLLDVRLLGPDGEVLLESRDRRVTGDRGARPLTRFNSVVYWSDVYIDFQRWARELQSALVAS